MKTLINPTPLNPKHLISSPFTSIKTFKQSPLPSSRPLIVKCSFEERNNGGLKDMVSGLVDKRVEELLNKEENRGLLDGLEKASLRVEMAKKELAEIERRELEASVMKTYVDEMETRASEIAECQKEILEARAMVEEAERSLSGLDENVGKDEERLESVKAAAISAVIGSLAGLPIALSQATSSTQLILPLAITFASCALFGVTFRYTIRRDLDDIHLKSGIVAAFGIVKGLAALGAGPPLELNSASFLSHAVNGAVYVSEDLLVFVFASVGLDYCFKMQLLSPFPTKKSMSETS